MRRQTHDVGLATRWGASPLDIDPRHLPARFELPVRGNGPQCVRASDHVIITNDCVALECDGHIEAHDISDFSGVAVRIEEGDAGFYAVSINLHHENPDLCIPLHVAYDMYEVGARWQSWARTLGLPLLLPTGEGTWREPFERLGKLVIKCPSQRDSRLGLKGRRSAISARRMMGVPAQTTHCGGEEIVARI